MTYFYDTYDKKIGMDGTEYNIHYKGRVYNVVDQQKNHRWYEVEQLTFINGEEVAFASFSDYQNGAYMEIPQSDLDRALIRKSKAPLQ